MIFISIFWYYHDIVILSCCIKISDPSTLGDIQANIWDSDTDITILKLSWYIKKASPSTLKHLQANIWELWYLYQCFNIIIILWYYHVKLSSLWTIQMLANIWVMVISLFSYYLEIVVLSWYLEILWHWCRYFNIIMIHHASLLVGKSKYHRHLSKMIYHEIITSFCFFKKW